MSMIPSINRCSRLIDLACDDNRLHLKSADNLHQGDLLGECERIVLV